MTNCEIKIILNLYHPVPYTGWMNLWLVRRAWRCGALALPHPLTTSSPSYRWACSCYQDLSPSVIIYSSSTGGLYFGPKLYLFLPPSFGKYVFPPLVTCHFLLVLCPFCLNSPIFCAYFTLFTPVFSFSSPFVFVFTFYPFVSSPFIFFPNDID